MKTIKELEADIKKWTPTAKWAPGSHTELKITEGKLKALKDVLKLMEELREVLADLEHEQWMKWSKYVAEHNELPKELTDKWAKNWKPYSKLDEKTKDFDRIWADKIIEELKARILR